MGKKHHTLDKASLRKREILAEEPGTEVTFSMEEAEYLGADFTDDTMTEQEAREGYLGPEGMYRGDETKGADDG